MASRNPYQPLAVTIPGGLIGQDFNQQAQDFTDAEKIAQALQAQDLNNQSVQLSVDAKQRQADQEKAIREALIARFGGDQPSPMGTITDPSGTPVDPVTNEALPGSANIGQQNNYDPKEALNIASRIAAQSGDLNSMVEIAKTQKQMNSAADRLLTPDELVILEQNGLKLPAGSSITDARLAVSLKNSGIQRDRVDNLQSRHVDNFGLSKEKFGYTKEKDTNAPGIFDPIVNPDTGNPRVITTHMQNTLSALEPSLSTVIRNGDDLINRLQTDRIAIGDPMAAQAQAIANMLPALRALDNQGVRFNEFIKGIDIQQLGDDAGLAHRIAGVFVGQDPVAAVDRFIKEIVKQTQDRVDANNAVINPDKVAAFDENLVPLWDKYGAFDRSRVDGALARGTAPAAGDVGRTGGVPRNPDGSVLSREQFQQYINSQGQ